MTLADDVRAVAELRRKATPGPWREGLGTVYPAGRQPGWKPLLVAEGAAIDARWPILAGENASADAAFIARVGSLDWDAFAAAVDFGAAWVEAEAALPEGWRLEVYSAAHAEGDINPWTGLTLGPQPGPYIAEAGHVWYGGPSWKGIDPPTAQADGPTPTAALHALTAKLREQP